MADWVPNFSNLESWQDAAKVLAFPMIMASWILQSGWQLEIPDSDWIIRVPEESEPYIKFSAFIIVFIGKCIWASAIGMLLYIVLLFVTVYLKFDAILVSAALFLTFGIYGIAGGQEVAEELSLQPIWFYTSIIYAFFLHSCHRDVYR
jgi:hypothetical protein